MKLCIFTNRQNASSVGLQNIKLCRKCYSNKMSTKKQDKQPLLLPYHYSEIHPVRSDSVFIASAKADTNRTLNLLLLFRGLLICCQQEPMKTAIIS